MCDENYFSELMRAATSMVQHHFMHLENIFSSNLSGIKGSIWFWSYNWILYTPALVGGAKGILISKELLPMQQS